MQHGIVEEDARKNLSGGKMRFADIPEWRI
jgi:hypothetical protein